MSHPDPLFDPDNAYEDDMNYDDYNDFYEDTNEETTDESWDDSYDDSMDGDAESAFGSCGWGVNEQYNSDYDSGDDW